MTCLKASVVFTITEVEAACWSLLVFYHVFIVLVINFIFRQMKLPQIQKILQEFEKQSEIMDMKEDMMNDAMDDALGDEGDEEET